MIDNGDLLSRDFAIHMKTNPVLNQVASLLAVLVFVSALTENAQASNRWEVLSWCSANTQADIARCEGFLNAAVDLRTSDDFGGRKSCFRSGTHLGDVRIAVVTWLKENRTAVEKSGLGLVARAIKERFPCPE